MLRSSGVTALAIIVMVLGGLTALGSVLSLVSAPHVATATEHRWQRFDDKLQHEERVGRFPSEETERMRHHLREFMMAVRDVQESPVVRTSTILNGLLGLWALLAAIGILVGKPWARTLLLCQAAASIVYAIWWTWMAVGVSEPLLSHLTAAAAPRDPQLEQVARTIGAAAQWIGVSLAVGWNGFILWFFNRWSVRMQFASPVRVV